MAKRERNEKSDSKSMDRRSFIKFAGLGAGAVGASVGLAAAPVQAEEVTAAGEHAGYSETEHVKAYYRMARF